jgi:hypothetical protein
MTDIIGSEVIRVNAAAKQFIALLIVVSTVVVLAKIFLRF